MDNLVDIETPLFILIDEVKSGNITANDLTEKQLDSLPKDVKQIALNNA